MNRYTRGIRHFDELIAIEQQRPRRIDGQSRGPRLLHSFDGRQSDHGYVEAHVLFRLGNLYDGEAAGQGGALKGRGLIVERPH